MFILFVCLSVQVTERVQTLSKDTEERRELLETRVKSWEVFPVEEAREVKNFVETLESSMTMELDENLYLFMIRTGRIPLIEAFS